MEVLDNLHFSRFLPMPQVKFDLSQSIESFGKHLQEDVWSYMRAGWRRMQLAEWSSDLQVNGLRGGPCIRDIVHHIKYLVRGTPVLITCIVDGDGCHVSDDDFYGAVQRVQFPMHTTCCLHNMLHYILQAEDGDSFIRDVLASKGWSMVDLEITEDAAESFVHRDTGVACDENEKENAIVYVGNVH